MADNINILLDSMLSGVGRRCCNRLHADGMCLRLDATAGCPASIAGRGLNHAGLQLKESQRSQIGVFS